MSRVARSLLLTVAVCLSLQIPIAPETALGALSASAFLWCVHFLLH